MVLIQDASFKKPKGKNWQKKYVQLDFSISIKELQKITKELLEESMGRNCYMPKDYQKQRWIWTAFMKKCNCKYCKPGWEAYEKASEKVK